MTLADRLANTPVPQSWSPKSSHKSGWEPGVKFDPDTNLPTELTSPVVPKIVGGDYQTILDTMGFELPEGYELRLTNAAYDPVAWTRDVAYNGDGKKTPAVTRPAWRYKFAIGPSEQRSRMDALALLARW